MTRRSVTVSSTDAVIWKTDTYAEASKLLKTLAKEAATIAVDDWDDSHRDVSVEITIKLTERRA
jgi:hypothetical protein